MQPLTRFDRVVIEDYIIQKWMKHELDETKTSIVNLFSKG